jgi:hypothetical protein
MEPFSPGQLVKVADGSRASDGVVFDVPSAAKVVVAIVDRRRGPVLRTVNATALSERTEEGPADPELRRLVRRTRPPAHRDATGATGTGRGRAGHSRSATHRTTGR